MDSLWNNQEAQAHQDDPLALCVYLSRLLGKEPALILHGGGNTSVKATRPNLFGDAEEILYIKGSGWNLETITAEGFAPVKLAVLQRMALLDSLTDTEMVVTQKSAMVNPLAPSPSVEALLHAIIPLPYVVHTHADAVVTISNTKQGQARLEEIYEDRVLVVPYVMPGFLLAKKAHTLFQNIQWAALDGIVLMNHGVVTFGNEARASYEKMIHLTSQAEDYLAKNKAWHVGFEAKGTENLSTLVQLRKAVSSAQGEPVLAKLETEGLAGGFAQLPNVADLSCRGPLTPDHVLRTKRIPMLLEGDVAKAVEQFACDYRAYFEKHTNGTQTCLDPAPRWVVWPRHGVVSFGKDMKALQAVSDIVRHTLLAIQRGEALGGQTALSEKDIFDIEYWELEQAKLRKTTKPPEHQGKIALVTGAASGIGRACVEELSAKGAAVVGLDIHPKVADLFQRADQVGMVCDLTQAEQIQEAVQATVRHFGGLDILVSNAGFFPESQSIESLEARTWHESLAVNLTSHQALLQACIPYLKWGIDPSVVVIASKNVPAPGPGAAAYSVAKAGLNQLARVAALELAPLGIRINTLHPNAIFDTGLWTQEVIAARAEHYQMTVEEYKANNLLNVEIRAKDVAALVSAMAGSVFAKTTGAQIPIDGGNERVI